MRHGIPIVLGLIATAATCLLVERSQTSAIVAFYRETLSGPTFALWLAALLAATICAPLCAVLFWSWARHMRRGWVLHLLLVPVIVILFQASEALLLYAAAEQGPDVLAGRALLPGLMLMIVSPLGYFTCLAGRSFGAWRRRNVASL